MNKKEKTLSPKTTPKPERKGRQKVFTTTDISDIESSSEHLSSKKILSKSVEKLHDKKEKMKLERDRHKSEISAEQVKKLRQNLKDEQKRKGRMSSVDKELSKRLKRLSKDLEKDVKMKELRAYFQRCCGTLSVFE